MFEGRRETMKLLSVQGLTFDEVEHVYRVNGIVMPSVTQIMRPLKDTEYHDVPESVMRVAADRGTKVHVAIDDYYTFGIEDIDPRYDGFFRAFLDWNDAVKPEPLATEQVLYHPHLRYCGTADLVAKIGDEVVLADYKTTATVSDMLVRVQLQAYESALREHGVSVTQKRIIQIRDGMYKEYIYPARDVEAWKVFLALKSVWDYIDKNKKGR